MAMLKRTMLAACAIGALALGGCATDDLVMTEDSPYDVTVDQAAEVAAAAVDAAAMDADADADHVDGMEVSGVCERYRDAGVQEACEQDQDTTNAVLLWVDAPTPEWSEGQGIRGLPILLKDNIETRDMPTTAGSLALANNAPGRDAPLVARLRDAGAVIVGKTNLSEWANIRSSNSTSGWSGVGGLTRNPYSLDRNSCGSSSGSGAAVAAGLAPAAIGTETDGSITCPAAINGIVGFKPTVGMVSRTHIVPISHSQDTAGPMTRTVEDAAMVLTAIAGTDPADPATAEADAHKVDFRAALDANSLRGARIGVMRYPSGYTADTLAVFEANLQVLRDAGAILIDITKAPSDEEAMNAAELTVFLYELKADMNAYLASTRPDQNPNRTLADLIAFNNATPREMALFGQELFIQAEATTNLRDPKYLEARATSLRLAGAEGIDRLMRDNDVVALIAPTTTPAWTTDIVNGDHYGGAVSTMPAIAGYPHLTVPMGYVKGLPVGMSFIAGKWQDAKVLSLGYAFEQLTHARHDPTLVWRVEELEDAAGLTDPAGADARNH